MVLELFERAVQCKSSKPTQTPNLGVSRLSKFHDNNSSCLVDRGRVRVIGLSQYTIFHNDVVQSYIHVIAIKRMIAFDDKASREDSLELCLSYTMMVRGAMCNAYLKMPRRWETNKHLKYIINGCLTFNFGYLRATQCCTGGGGYTLVCLMTRLSVLHSFTSFMQQHNLSS